METAYRMEEFKKVMRATNGVCPICTSGVMYRRNVEFIEISLVRGSKIIIDYPRISCECGELLFVNKGFMRIKPGWVGSLAARYEEYAKEYNVGRDLSLVSKDISDVTFLQHGLTYDAIAMDDLEDGVEEHPRRLRFRENNFVYVPRTPIPNVAIDPGVFVRFDEMRENIVNEMHEEVIVEAPTVTYEVEGRRTRNPRNGVPTRNPNRNTIWGRI